MGIPGKKIGKGKKPEPYAIGSGYRALSRAAKKRLLEQKKKPVKGTGLGAGVKGQRPTKDKKEGANTRFIRKILEEIDVQDKKAK